MAQQKTAKEQFEEKRLKQIESMNYEELVTNMSGGTIVYSMDTIAKPDKTDGYFAK